MATTKPAIHKATTRGCVRHREFLQHSLHFSQPPTGSSHSARCHFFGTGQVMAARFSCGQRMASHSSRVQCDALGCVSRMTLTWNVAGGDDRQVVTVTGTLSVAGDVCHLPEATGACRQSLVRWRFDRDAATCRSFIYTGCDGNANNFNTLEECKAVCPGKSPEWSQNN